jgi:CheY-like chemotaxis protein
MQGSGSVKILLVEDDDGDARAIERAFRQARIANEIHRVIDGVEALDVLRGDIGTHLIPPYIVLADINMPRMNGIELIKTMRQDEVLKRSIVFMLTTSRNDEDVVAAYELNVAGYILKSRAGEDFANVVHLIDCYWRVVEMPRV